MWENVIATLIAAAITGPIGYFVKSKLTKEKYLPDAPALDSKQMYRFVSGNWYLYHFTIDSKLSKFPILVSSKLQMVINSNLVVNGFEDVQVDHRRALNYKLRGQIRAGQLHFTCICAQDSSEVYSGMFPNLLDDDAIGIIIARDYDRNLYASPALISKKQKNPDEAISILNNSEVKFYHSASSSSNKKFG
ncbi:hypothetical protein BCD64_27005 [Nostoc sp. MBR 210]|nr:hypothetical protein BCD64_27005 [Nostoc sp. MBR 210]